MDKAISAVQIQQIPIDQITASPYQARKSFDEDKLKAFAETIKEHGLMNAINVRPVGDHFGPHPIDGGGGPYIAPPHARYELIAGERRVRAAKLLGWKTIAATVEAVDDTEAAERVIIENIQREDLSAIEQAQAYRGLSEPPFNLNQSRIARQVGKDQSLINKYIMAARLRDNPEGMNAFIPLALRQLLELCRLPKYDDQAALAREAIEKELTASQLKHLVDQKLGPKPKRKRKPVSDPLADLWSQILDDPSVASPGTWYVTYGPLHVPGPKGLVSTGWHFHVGSPEVMPKTDLKRWFQSMADAMGDTSDEQKKLDKVTDVWGAKNENEMLQMEKEAKNPRLPKNQEEQAELEKLATKGPGSVYRWIYGQDSIYAKKADAVTWKDMDASGPTDGLHKVIEGIKELQKLAVS